MEKKIVTKHKKLFKDVIIFERKMVKDRVNELSK